MRQLRQMLRHAGSATSSREIAVVLGIARSTVQDNLQRVGSNRPCWANSLTMLWRTNSSLATASNRARDDASNPITRKPTSGANVLGRRGAVGVRVGDVARLARHRTGLPRRQALVPETMRDGEERAGAGLRTARSACGVSLRLGTRRAYPGLRCLAQTRLFPGRRIRRSGQRCHGILAQRLSGSSNGEQVRPSSLLSPSF